MALILSQQQRERLESLWFLYGNYGRKHSDAGHRFLQTILERSEDRRDLFRPSAELIERVDQILRAQEK